MKVQVFLLLFVFTSFGSPLPSSSPLSSLTQPALFHAASSSTSSDSTATSNSTTTSNSTATSNSTTSYPALPPAAMATTTSADTSAATDTPTTTSASTTTTTIPAALLSEQAFEVRLAHLVASRAFNKDHPRTMPTCQTASTILGKRENNANLLGSSYKYFCIEMVFKE
ncbi:hypothetical protein EV426DRAFT_283095 [Tirmania nivea]|nr:hypothetical protein EV426DRAFT_283095 [Tirmania nivea]